MRHIPGQIFLAGPRDDSAARRGKTIRKDYWIGVVPVSQALWSKVTGAEVGSGPAATMPITGVSWFAAIDFANRLSEMDGFVPAYRVRGRAVSQRKDGNGYRLPTEAEWECAARAGGTSDYAGSDDIDRVAWYRGNSDGRLQPSGQKQPNANGLHDMSGNAATWCWDETEDKDSVEVSLPIQIGTVPCERPAHLPEQLERIGAVDIVTKKMQAELAARKSAA